MLGRGGFSEALGNAIRGWLGRESLVLALYGAWGNGKSSIKNMVIEYLQAGSPKILTLDFNPWQLTNRPTLSEAFFDELGIAFGKGDLGSRAVRKSVLARYRRWARRLQGGRDFVDATRSLFGAVLIFLGVATLGAAGIHSRIVTFVLGCLLLVVGVFSLVSKFIDATIKFLEAGTEIGAKSLSEVKAEIADDLKKLKAPILVVLDDLDRLTPQEILEVFQLIKANGDFPNLIYLVLGERSIVENNIAKALNVSGRDYLEKIVQVAFDVPLIDVTRVHEVLLQRLDSLLCTEDVLARFSKKRWANVFLSGLRPYFTTLRDVNRFTSTLSFHFSCFSAEGVFEVNPIDLIALEVIRLYEPDVYMALQSNKELLTSVRRAERPQPEVAKKAVESMIEMGSPDRRVQLRELIKHLFPSIEWAMSGSQYGQEFGEKWYRDLRVCSPKVFDRYFRLTVSDQELSQAVVLKLLQARGNRSQLRTELETLDSRGLLTSALEELATHHDTIEPTWVEPFITAIFDVADSLPEGTAGMYEIPVYWRVAFLIQRALDRLGDIGARLKALTNAISNTDGLFMPAEFVLLVDTPRESGTGALTFSPAEAVEAKHVALRKIEVAAVSGALAKHPRLAILLGVWRKWGKSEDVSDYVAALTETEVGTLQLLRSLVVRSLSHGAGDYIAT